jgi:hypothetical protein
MCSDPTYLCNPLMARLLEHRLIALQRFADRQALQPVLPPEHLERGPQREHAIDAAGGLQKR